MSTLYAERVDGGEIKNDPAQLACLPIFDQLHADLQVKPRGFWQRLLGHETSAPNQPRGIYLWGGVGRGKSMLMDLFVSSLHTVPSRRVHFHAFMQEVHDAMAIARQRNIDDPLAHVAKEIAGAVKVFAFDEMQITDITDAMIVGRLFEKLFEQNVIIVTTSNREPGELYKNGLNRQLFLPFIALIKETMTVHELASPTDHRQERLAGSKTYFSPVSKEVKAEIDQIWLDLTHGEAMPLSLTIKGRDVLLPAFHNGLVRANFQDLCGKMLGPGDYLEIAKTTKLLVLEEIPQMSRDNFNEAKRFVTLIDALYEARVGVIISAAAEPEQLYQAGSGAFEFERTASRLREMQSQDWMSS